MIDMSDKVKIVFKQIHHPSYKRVLEANWLYTNGAVTMTGMGNEDMDEIVDWCRQHRYGRRIAFNMFSFRSDQELTAFLLRWG